jgi:hypothetical protein
MSKFQKEEELRVHLDPDVEKLLIDGAARAGVTPEKLLVAIMTAELAKPVPPKQSTGDIITAIHNTRVREHLRYALLHTAGSVMDERDNYEKCLKFYDHAPDWSGKAIYTKVSHYLQRLSHLLPQLCNALDKAEETGGEVEITINVRRKE